MNIYSPMNAVFDPDLLTLDDALVKLFAREDIPFARKLRVKAAVAKTSRLLGMPSDKVPAQLSYLTRQLNRFRPPPGSPGRKTIANTKSECTGAFARGQVQRRGRNDHHLSVHSVRRGQSRSEILHRLWRRKGKDDGRGRFPNPGRCRSG